jgi:hypothetical protein
MHPRPSPWIARFALAALVACAWIASAQGEPAAAQNEAAAALVGTWQGQIETPPLLDVLVRFEVADGGPSGTIDIPAQGAAGLPLEAIEIEGTAVRFAIAGLTGTPTFDGTIDGGRIEGTFGQGALTFPFSLERVEDEPIAQTAADEVYEDPEGAFAVTVPVGWTTEERVGHLVLIGPEGGIRVVLLTFEDDDLEAAVEATWATYDAEFDAPIDEVLEPPSVPGVERTVVVSYDNPAGRIHQAIGQLFDGVAHVLLVDADLEPVHEDGALIDGIFRGYRILALAETDPTGAE